MKQKTIHFFVAKVDIIVISAIVLLTFNTVLTMTIIPTGSMSPKIKPYDIVISSCIPYESESPERGDIVIFKMNNTNYCKRIVGVGGDEIIFQNGYTYINGKRLDETYLDTELESNAPGTYVVPDGHFFMMGDNRELSFDSRHWLSPYIAETDINTKMLFVIPTHAIADIINECSNK